MTTPITEEENKFNSLIRLDRMPHIWCAGCGIGPAVGCFIRAIESSGLDPDKIALISGIGCAGRAAGYVKLDSFHTTHGRALPFATGLKVGNPDLNVVVFSGDGDLVAIGGNHLIHAARRNVDMLVICSNNFNYGMTGAQYGPTTPQNTKTPTSPYGSVENPFNLVALVASAGATMVSRWTVFHVYQLKNAIKKGLSRKGFSFIEVISPCTTGFGRLSRLSPLEMMRMLRDNAKVKKVHPTEATIDPFGEIILGDFVEAERPTFNDALAALEREIDE